MSIHTPQHYYQQIFSIKLIPGCDNNGPALCVDISDEKGLLCFRNIINGNSSVVFPTFTVQQLESSGIFQGNLFY